MYTYTYNITYMRMQPPHCKVYSYIFMFFLKTYTYIYNIYIYMGVSENSVPLNPMVLLIIIPIKWLLNGYNWEYTLFSDKPISLCHYI